MSFHGIPQPYADKGDPYADRCRMTAKLVAEALHLNEDEWAISFNLVLVNKNGLSLIRMCFYKIGRSKKLSQCKY
jgi:hypothetical protein